MTEHSTESAEGRASRLIEASENSLENRYYAYLRAQGFIKSEALLNVLGVYLPHFDGLAHVGDLGCGHGEFLEMLRDAGHTVAGVDIDAAMVDACRAKGFEVEFGDAERWMRARPGQFDALFSSNVIEHLPADTVRAWVAAAYMALRPGGMVMLTTPNPASAIVHLHEFWRDPTHVRMYAAQLVEFMLVDAGFTAVQSMENEAARWEGIDALLAGVDEPLPTHAAPPAIGAVAPLPSPPTAGGLRARWAYGVSSWAYRKFTEPYVLPLRQDLAHAHSVIEAQAVLEQTLAARINRLAYADRFLYPSREIAVFGYKPAANNLAPTE